MHIYLEKILRIGSSVINKALHMVGLEIRKILPKYLKKRRAIKNIHEGRGIRLYIGCGEDIREGYIGCDIRDLPTVDFVCNAWEISKYYSEVDEIYSRHMLEHLTLAQFEETMRDWMRSLKVGGKINIIVPNMDFHVEQWQRAIWNEETWGQQFSDARHAFAGFWGWQRESSLSFSSGKENDYYWDVHKCGFNKKSLEFMLTRLGYSHIDCKILDNVHLVANAIKNIENKERQVSPTLQGIREDHRARYEFSCKYIPKHAKVLDVACGIGYGAYIIAKQSECESVVAIDISKDTIEYGKKYYASDKIKYIVNDFLSADIDLASFDVIVSFETIEHVQEDEFFLAKVYDSLTSGGMFICSSPNQGKMPYNSNIFPFHIRHYSPYAFENILKKTGFEILAKYSQFDNQSNRIDKGWEGSFNIAVCRKR